MFVEEQSSIVGKTIEEAGLRNLPEMYLMEIDREGHVVAAVSSEERLQANDRLVFVGVVESIIDLQKIPGLMPAADQVFKLDSPRSERRLVEAVVSNSFPFLNMTIRESRFRSHYNAAIVAVARNGERINMKIGDISLQAGDTLLLEAHASFQEVQRNSRDFFLVSIVENSELPKHEKTWMARLILFAMIVLAATEVISMFKSAMMAAGLMIGTRCCRGSQAKNAIDLGVLITIAAGLGLGKAMEVSGAAQWLAESCIQSVGNHPHVVLAMIYLLTMILTNLITAKAAAVLIFPIAVASAQTLGGLSVTPFVVALTISAAASFATPIGYQTNLMVYGPGGYRFTDYLRLGIPLSLLVGMVSLILIPMVWPF